MRRHPCLPLFLLLSLGADRALAQPPDDDDDDPKRAGHAAPAATPKPKPPLPSASGLKPLPPAIEADSLLDIEEEEWDETTVPDASWRAMKGRSVTVLLRNGRERSGELIAVEPETVTLISSRTGEVVTVRRSEVVSLRALRAQPHLSPVEAPEADAGLRNVEPPEKERYFGIHVGLAPGLALDIEYGYFYSFISSAFVFPIASDGELVGGTLGVGTSFRLGATSRWRFDLFAHVSPARFGGGTNDTGVGIGVGAGVHYTARNGFAFGIKLPIIGGAAGGSINTPGESVGFYYLFGALSFPVLSLGYRF